MRFFITSLASCLILALAGCSKPNPALTSTASPSPAAPQTKPSGLSKNQLNPCSLLTAEEIRSIQGNAPTDTKPSTKSVGGLTVSQCYFLLPTAADSIVVVLTQPLASAEVRSKSDAGDPAESWREIFHTEHEEAKEREEEKEKAKPEEIAGLGDEAFWSAQRFGGVLYVLKGKAYFSISVGGAGDQATKLQKSKSLAEVILKRL